MVKNEVILSLLSCLEHFLKDLPMMSSVESLDDAMLREDPPKARDKTRAQAFHKSDAHTDREMSLVGKWLGHVHQLLKI